MLGRFSCRSRRPRRPPPPPGAGRRSLLLTLAPLIPASRFRVETQLEALLPEGAPAAEDYRDLPAHLRRLREGLRAGAGSPRGSVEPESLINAASELADTHGAEPAGGRGPRRAHRGGRALLLRLCGPAHAAPRPGAGLAGGPRPPAGAGERSTTGWPRCGRALRSPVGTVAAPLFAADPLGLSEGLLGAAASSLPIDPLSGAFISRDGDATLVILTPARAEVDPAGGRALMAELEQGLRARCARRPGMPLDFRAVGGPIYAAQDEALFAPTSPARRPAPSWAWPW